MAKKRPTFGQTLGKMGELASPYNMAYALGRTLPEPVKAFGRAWTDVGEGKGVSVPDAAMMGMASMGGAAFGPKGSTYLGTGGGNLAKQFEPVPTTAWSKKATPDLPEWADNFPKYMPETDLQYGEFKDFLLKLNDKKNANNADAYWKMVDKIDNMGFENAMSIWQKMDSKLPKSLKQNPVDAAKVIADSPKIEQISTKTLGPDLGKEYEGWFEVTKPNEGPNSSMFLPDVKTADAYAAGKISKDDAFDFAMAWKSGDIKNSMDPGIYSVKSADGFWEITSDPVHALNLNKFGVQQKPQTPIKKEFGSGTKKRSEYSYMDFQNAIADAARVKADDLGKVRGYHGTQRKGEEVFEKFRLPERGSSEPGVFFADNPRIAEEYGNTIYPVEMQLDNVAVVDIDQVIKQEQKKLGLEHPMDLPIDMERIDATDNFAVSYAGGWMSRAIKAAKESGRDFLVIKNMRDMGGFQNQIIALEPVGKVRPAFAPNQEPLFAQGLPTDAMRGILNSVSQGEEVTITGTEGLGIFPKGVVLSAKRGTDNFNNIKMDGMPVVTPKAFLQQIKRNRDAINNYVRQNPNVM